MKLLLSLFLSLFFPLLLFTRLFLLANNNIVSCVGEMPKGIKQRKQIHAHPYWNERQDIAGIEKKAVAASKIRTCAGRTQWISSPTP